MKKFLLLIIVIVVAKVSFSQNYDFENWTSDTLLKLDDYQTTIDDWGVLGEDAIVRSTDSYSGTYSVYLETVETEFDTISGYFFNGDPETYEDGHESPVSLIDSIVGYYKCDVMPGDSAILLFIPKYNGAPTGGGVFHFTGTQSNWTRFSFPVNAAIADSFIFAAASSNA